MIEEVDMDISDRWSVEDVQDEDLAPEGSDHDCHGEDDAEVAEVGPMHEETDDGE